MAQFFSGALWQKKVLVPARQAKPRMTKPVLTMTLAANQNLLGLGKNPPRRIAAASLLATQILRLEIRNLHLVTPALTQKKAQANPTDVAVVAVVPIKTVLAVATVEAAEAVAQTDVDGVAVEVVETTGAETATETLGTQRTTIIVAVAVDVTKNETTSQLNLMMQN
jgi:hypothetical protein